MAWAWLQTLGLPLWLPRCRRGLITAVISFGSFSTQCLMPKSPEVDNPNKSKQGNLLWCKDTNCLWAGVLQHVCSLWGFLDLNGAPMWQVCSHIDVLSRFRLGISWSLGLRLDSQPFWCGDRHTKQHSPEQIGIYRIQWDVWRFWSLCRSKWVDRNWNVVYKYFLCICIYIYRIWCHCVKRFHVPSQDEDSYKPRFELLQLKSGAQSSREK